MWLAFSSPSTSKARYAWNAEFTASSAHLHLRSLEFSVLFPHFAARQWRKMWKRHRKVQALHLFYRHVMQNAFPLLPSPMVYGTCSGFREPRDAEHVSLVSILDGMQDAFLCFPYAKCISLVQICDGVWNALIWFPVACYFIWHSRFPCMLSFVECLALVSMSDAFLCHSCRLQYGDIFPGFLTSMLSFCEMS